MARRVDMCELAVSHTAGRTLFGPENKFPDLSRTILVVDDEEIVIEVTKEILEATGYRVQTASTGQEAVDLYQRKKDQIQVVILDMVMPGMDCVETLERLRLINPTAKIVLSSGYSMNNEIKKMMAQGANCFLPKPFRIEQLLKTIGDVLQSSQQ